VKGGFTSVNKRQHLTGAQALIASLQAFQVDTLFGIPGVHTLPIYDVLRETPGIRHILGRHEQGAGFMAEGYARVTGRPGIVSTITGPGVTNATTPMGSAFADSIPLMVISSGPARASVGRNRGELHEVKNQAGIMEALAGWTRCVQHVEEIPGAIQDAMRVMLQGRPRGAYLQIPLDVLREKAYVTLPDEEDLTYTRPQPATADIQAAAHLLREAQFPVIVAGAGVTFSGANTELVQLAERLQAPVILGSKSHDVLSSAHPLAILTTAYITDELDPLLTRADVALVIGSKLGAERTAYGRMKLPRTLIHIDIDASEFGRNYPASLGIVSDARAALEALLPLLPEEAPARPELPALLDEARAAVVAHTRAYFGEGVCFLPAIREALPHDAIVVADMTMLGYASTVSLPIYEPRTFIHPNEYCTIGCGLPLALGAKVAAPKQPVIALCGDAGFLLNIAEMATAVQEQIPVIAVVFNDSTFTAVKTEQRAAYDRRYIATDVIEPDYVALAQAFRAYGTRVSTPEALRDALREALTLNCPTVIEVQLPPKQW